MTGDARYADWIAVDWGTSRLRAWAMADGRPRAEATSDAGMGTLERAGFEPALLQLIEPWLGSDRVDVLACGMVGARQGWIEAPYVAVPTGPLNSPPVSAPVGDSRIAVRIVPGLKQDSPPDVMRGEETQIAGWIAENPGRDGILCLPGSHTKWVEVSAGEVVSFRTFMTGELHAALGRSTVLRHSLDDAWDEPSFLEALSDAISRPEALAGRLFGIRAEGLLHGLAPGAAPARLSGLLIGAELAASRPYWLGREVTIVGASGLASRYASALAAQGVSNTSAAVDEMTLAGLDAARMMEAA